jgi:hypothetical protein
MYLCTLYLFQAPIETTVENHEGSDKKKETNEMTLVEEVGK